MGAGKYARPSSIVPILALKMYIIKRINCRNVHDHSALYLSNICSFISLLLSAPDGNMHIPKGKTKQTEDTKMTINEAMRKYRLPNRTRLRPSLPRTRPFLLRTPPFRRPIRRSLRPIRPFRRPIRPRRRRKQPLATQLRLCRQPTQPIRLL